MDTWLTLLMLLTAGMIVFEMGQLVVAERFIGMRQIRAGRHPEMLDNPPATMLSIAWIMGIVMTWCYMILLLSHPKVAFQGICMIVVSMIGFALRRVAGVNYGLIVLTIEGAARMGLAVNMLISVYLFHDDKRFTWTKQLFE